MVGGVRAAATLRQGGRKHDNEARGRHTQVAGETCLCGGTSASFRYLFEEGEREESFVRGGSWSRAMVWRGGAAAALPGFLTHPL